MPSPESPESQFPQGSASGKVVPDEKLESSCSGDLPGECPVGRTGVDFRLVENLRPGIRLLLRRSIPVGQVEETTAAIISRTMDRVRDGEITSSDGLLRSVRQQIAEQQGSLPAKLVSPQHQDLRGASTSTSPLVHALRQLPERDRSALASFYLDGVPAEEVCKQYGISADKFAKMKANLRDAHRSSLRHGPAADHSILPRVRARAAGQ